MKKDNLINFRQRQFKITVLWYWPVQRPWPALVHHHSNVQTIRRNTFQSVPIRCRHLSDWPRPRCIRVGILGWPLPLDESSRFSCGWVTVLLSSHKKYSLSARLHSRVYQNTEKMSVNQKIWRVTRPCTDILVSTEYQHSQPINASETGLPSSTLTMSHKLQLAF